jgi:hypothetical protein
MMLCLVVILLLFYVCEIMWYSIILVLSHHDALTLFGLLIIKWISCISCGCMVLGGALAKIFLYIVK